MYIVIHERKLYTCIPTAKSEYDICSNIFKSSLSIILDD